MFRSLRVKPCMFCKNKSQSIDYKDVSFLRTFTTEKGKILPRRVSGCCARHQRVVAAAVKRARHAAFVPFQAE